MPSRAIKPPARFEPNLRDVAVGSSSFPYRLLKKLGCFKNLEDHTFTELQSLPGTIIIRFFKKGGVICQQDNPGYTAFYMLTKEEIEALAVDGILAAIKLEGWQEDRVASVHREFYGTPAKRSEPVYIGQGEIFGEMSCLYRVPRTATVTAMHDCYVLECMRNVFSRAGFEEILGNKVVERILELHLRGFELFDKYSRDEEDAFRKIVLKIKERLDKTAAEKAKKPKKGQTPQTPDFMQSRKHNEILFDEHDRPDGLYIIRLGLVKIVKDASALLGMASIHNWGNFQAALAGGTTPLEGPCRNLWLKLREDTNAAPLLARIEADPAVRLDPMECQEILYAINALLKLKSFHQLVQYRFDSTRPQDQMLEEEAKTLKESKDFDETCRLRTFNRRLLEIILHGTIHPFGATPPRTLAFRSSREWVFQTDDDATRMAESALIGEMGLFRSLPRSATCVAYSHPRSKFGDSKLLYIDKQLFDDLLEKPAPTPDAEKPNAKAKYLSGVVEGREKHTVSRMQLPVWTESGNLQRFDELGVIQGKKLMLIDLDRCTRCDKCVEACVESHAPAGPIETWVQNHLPARWLAKLPFFNNTGPRDGRSRLFLDGPRIQIAERDRIKTYLVPSTCRQCKDAVCLLDCPVCSIHKGENGQIVIEDWCIGCVQCAMYCPYGAIQMHTVGVIARGVFGWRYSQQGRPAAIGATPFRDNRDFRVAHDGETPIEFSYSFDLLPEHTRKSSTFMLHVESSATDVQAVINGVPINLQRLEQYETYRGVRWNWKTMLAQVGGKTHTTLAGDEAPQTALQLGRNDIGIQLTLPASKQGDVLLDVGLSGYVLPVVDKAVAGDDYRQDWVMKTAVVCDMCSGQPGQEPACVNACPHEAAERRFVTLR